MPELDGLRAVAALGIVVTHVAFQTGTESVLFERFDYFVAVFYALSAFLLLRGGIRTGYYQRRLARIAPAYVVCVVVVMAVLPPLSTLSAGQVCANLFLLQIYVPDGLVAGLTHLWSLCVEVAFYLVVPLYARRSPRVRRALIAAGVLFGLLWPHVIAPLESATALNLQIWPPSYLPWFAVGMFCAELERSGVRYLGPRWPFPLAALGFAWFAGVIGPPGLAHPTPAEFNARVILGTVFAACFVMPYALGRGGGVGQAPRPERAGVLASPVMRTLGKWSYSLFLWHVAVLYFAFPVLGVPLLSGNFLLVLVFTVVVGVAVSFISYELVEVPGARLVRSLGASGHPRHATAKQPATASSHESPA